MRIVGLALALLALAACGGSGYTTQTQQVENMTISFEHPTTATLLQTYDLFVTLKSGSQPAENADVVLSLDMPAMEMATNRPVAEPAGNGRYKVTTAFTMEGDWTIVVTATAGGKQYEAMFDQVVKAQQ